MESIFEKMEYMVEDGISINSKEMLKLIQDIHKEDLFYGEETKTVVHLDRLQYMIKDDLLVSTEFHRISDYAVKMVENEFIESLEQLLGVLRREYLKLLIRILGEKIELYEYAIKEANDALAWNDLA